MTPREALVEQICALSLAERLQIREALDESVDRDLAESELKAGVIDSSSAHRYLEAEVLRGLDSGPMIPVDEAYWLEIQSRIAHRRQSSQ